MGGRGRKYVSRIAGAGKVETASEMASRTTLPARNNAETFLPGGAGGEGGAGVFNMY